MKEIGLYMRSVVLIGPYGVGKSTIGQLLADSRGQRRYSLDECAWTYYREIGLAPETAEALGDFASQRWQPYHAHAVKRFLQDHQNEVCVMDLGAGHALYEAGLTHYICSTPSRSTCSTLQT